MPSSLKPEEAQQESPQPTTHTHTPRMHWKGKGPQMRFQKRSDRRLEEVAKAVGGRYCRLQMPLSLAVAIGGGGEWLHIGWAPGREGGVTPSFQCIAVPTSPPTLHQPPHCPQNPSIPSYARLGDSEAQTCARRLRGWGRGAVLCLVLRALGPVSR